MAEIGFHGFAEPDQTGDHPLPESISLLKQSNTSTGRCVNFPWFWRIIPEPVPQDASIGDKLRSTHLAASRFEARRAVKSRNRVKLVR